MSTVLASPMIIVPIAEQVICMHCQSAIGRECVTANISKRTGIQTVRAYCEHCDKLFEADRRLTDCGERWQMIGTVRLIEDPKSRSGFLARIAHVRNEVYQEQTPLVAHERPHRRP